MAKKKSTKVKEEAPIEDESENDNDSNEQKEEVAESAEPVEEPAVTKEEFLNACVEYRKAKIEEDKYSTIRSTNEKIIKRYAITNEIKGVVEGVEIKQRFSFLPDENVQKAKEMGIEVPATGSLVLPETQLKDIIVKAGLDPKKLMTYTPDIASLKKLFKKAKIEGVYSLGVSVGISDVD